MQTVLESKRISKRFPGVLALDNVDFSLEKGEVHALLGENGAGKSTLVKIITGAYTKDEGEIYINGESVDFQTPIEAREAGIGIIYQEFSQVSTLTVAENIFLGDYPYKNGIVDWKTLNANAQKLLDRFGVNARPRDILSTLGVATRQMVEILKVIHREDLEILIMDEPTSALTAGETKLLFEFVNTLKKHRVSIIYISHRLDEIKQICDRVTIFKNGKKVTTEKVDKLSIDDIVSLMVGQELKDHYPEKSLPTEEKMLEIDSITGKNFNNITFTAHKGEVLGITGLVGSGKSETVEAIFGASKINSGSIKIDGKEVTISSPKDAINKGIGLIPESRKEQGLVLILSNLFNISLASLKKLAKPILNLKQEKEEAKQLITDLEVRPPLPYSQVANLSGGNQQKIVIAKWLMRDCDILIFDEPTRGIDVGAKFQIYSLIIELARMGKCIIVASSEIEEVIGICNRALIMKDYKIINQLQGSDLNKEKVIACMSGVNTNE